jgi:hypothetical protein
VPSPAATYALELNGADGLAYLDVARAYVRYDWHTAINGYWGPLYAWLLAIEMRLLHLELIPQSAYCNTIMESTY